MENFLLLHPPGPFIQTNKMQTTRYCSINFNGFQFPEEHEQAQLRSANLLQQYTLSLFCVSVFPHPIPNSLSYFLYTFL